MRVTLVPAFVLHTRAFNETSVILDVFSLPHGRVSLLAKGVRSQRSRFRGFLRPFVPLLLSWSGKSELMTLTGVECQVANTPVLVGSSLLSGMYLNELLVRLLPKSDSHPELFLSYQNTLPLLMHAKEVEKALRLFEKKLLQELGYHLSFDQEATSLITPIVEDETYVLKLDQGFVRHTTHRREGALFEGKHLLALHQEILDTKETLSAAKRLMRLLIAHRLDNRPLKTREFFRMM